MIKAPDLGRVSLNSQGRKKERKRYSQIDVPQTLRILIKRSHSMPSLSGQISHGRYTMYTSASSFDTKLGKVLGLIGLLSIRMDIPGCRCWVYSCQTRKSCRPACCVLQTIRVPSLSLLHPLEGF